MPARPTPPRFDARWNKRQRRRSLWRRWRWTLTALALIGGLTLFRDTNWGMTAEWTPVTDTFRLCGDGGSGPCVIDGDTVAMGKKRVRLTGFDAPETNGACANERVMAMAARAALFGWLGKGAFEWDGGAAPPHDKYGRELRSARRGSERLADHMTDAGLASGGGWGTTEIDWCPAAD